MQFYGAKEMIAQANPFSNNFYRIEIEDPFSNAQLVFLSDKIQLSDFIRLDGIPILDANKMTNYDPPKVETINVVTKKYSSRGIIQRDSESLHLQG